MPRRTPETWWDDYAPAVAAIVRVVGAMLIAYMFAVVLMTAIAQSEVVAKLGKVPDADYASSYAELIRANEVAPKLNAMRAERAIAEAEFEAANQIDQAAGTNYQYGYQNQVLALVTRLKDGPCDVVDPERVSANTVGATIDAIQSCVSDSSSSGLLPRSLSTAITAMAADRAGAVEAARVWLDANRKMLAAKGRLQPANAETARLQALYDAGKTLRGPFSPVLIMRENGILGGRVLVQFPPAMMQVLIAFFSGAFGSLLLALVLIVYPNTDLGLTRPGGNYGERILLGGLIAVCVYIVLGGGTAVLGSGAASHNETMNFQAFSAIGVLAGMFSDRVAQWLSGRANMFYGDRTRAGAAGAGATGAGVGVGPAGGAVGEPTMI